MGKKRVALRMGMVVSMQDINEATNVVEDDYIVNVLGGSYERLEQEEAVLFQNELEKQLGDDLGELTKKVAKIAAAFGLEQVIGVPPSKR